MQISGKRLIFADNKATLQQQDRKTIVELYAHKDNHCHQLSSVPDIDAILHIRTQDDGQNRLCPYLHRAHPYPRHSSLLQYTSEMTRTRPR